MLLALKYGKPKVFNGTDSFGPSPDGGGRAGRRGQTGGGVVVGCEGRVRVGMGT